MSNIKIENIIGKSAKLTNNPDTFLPEVSWIKVNAKKEKGTQGVTFSEKAMSDLGLYVKMHETSVYNRVYAIPSYNINGKPEFVIEPTYIDRVKEIDGVKLPKIFSSVKVVQSTRIATSNELWSALVAKFNIDTTQKTYFVIEQIEGVFVVTPYTKPVFDEGKDVEVTSSEKQVILEEEAEA